MIFEEKMADATKNVPEVAEKSEAEVVEKTETAADKTEPEVTSADGETVSDLERNIIRQVEYVAVEKTETAADKTEIEVKSADGETVSDLERNIIRQMEYYFGDINLQRDKYLQGKIAENEGGWVPISVLLTFKRLATFTTDPEVIVKSLKKSKEGLIEISANCEQVRRHPERPIIEQNKERREEMTARTVYATGFVLEANKSEIVDWFIPYGKIVNIFMKKCLDCNTKEYKFNGSILITFETKQQAENFIQEEKVLFKGKPILRKWEKEFIEEKKDVAKAKAKIFGKNPQ